MTIAITVDQVWKNFRMYHEKNQYIKAALLRGRRARYDEFWAVKDVSFEIPFGTAFGIIGANGSGKSTLLKCIAGILTPDKGQLSLSGRMSALLELGAGFHPELSGRENIFLNGAILGMTNNEIKARYDDIVEFAGLGEFIDTPVKNFSSGMVVRLGFAVATNVDPEILIIDEVLAVGDQEFQQRCAEKIEQFRSEGRTIVLVSHGLSDIEKLCTQVAWLEKGALRALGPASEVVSDYSSTSFHSREKLEGEIGERWGTGEVEITKIDLLDANNKVQTNFTTGELLRIRVHFNAHEKIVNGVLGVGITHLHGTYIFGTNTRNNAIKLPDLLGAGYVDFVIDQLPLLNGTYDLSFQISDHSQVHHYDHWEKKTRFDVHQSRQISLGLVAISGRWIV